MFAYVVQLITASLRSLAGRLVARLLLLAETDKMLALRHLFERTRCLGLLARLKSWWCLAWGER